MSVSVAVLKYFPTKPPNMVNKYLELHTMSQP